MSSFGDHDSEAGGDLDRPRMSFTLRVPPGGRRARSSHRSIVNLFAEFDRRLRGRRRSIQRVDQRPALTSPSTKFFSVSRRRRFGAICADEIERSVCALFVARRAGHPARLPSRVFVDRDAECKGRPPLSRLLVGVEPISEQLLVRIAERSPGLELINGYGPTEATILLHAASRVPETGVGAQYANRPARAERANLSPGLFERARSRPGSRASFTWEGSDWLTATGIAEDLTAKLRPDRFHSGGGARLYRTGDRARHLQDGTIQFLGRLDDQVKIRGFRIEPREIESVLRQHAGVRHAVVVVREDVPGRKNLVAYVAADGLESTELRGYLANRLPEYMVPSHVMILRSCRDVERQGGPQGPARSARTVDRAGVRASTQRGGEEAGRDWASVLELPRVGLRDNFFELGGDSILSIRDRGASGTSGPPAQSQTNVRAPNIAELAEVASLQARAPSQQSPVTGPLPLTAIQTWWLRQEHEEPAHFNQARMLEPLQRVEPEWIDERQQRCSGITMGSVRPSGAASQTGRRRIQPISGRISFELVDFEPAATSARGANDRTRIDGPKQHGSRGGRSREAGSVRAGLRTAAETARGGASPRGRRGVAWAILLEDSAHRTRAAAARRGDPLGAKTSSFADWSRRIAAYARSPELEAEIDHWETAAGRGGGRGPEGPATDENRNALSTVRVESTPSALPRSVGQVGQVYRSGPDDLLLAALGKTLALWTGRATTVVDVEGHGRQELFDDRSQPNVGWFTTISLVRLCAEGNWRDTLDAIKQQHRRGRHRGIGYGLLCHLGSEDSRRRLGRFPERELLFNYLGRAMGGVGRAPGVRDASESAGANSSDRMVRSHWLELNARLEANRLVLECAFSTSCHDRESVARFAEHYIGHLGELINHCRTPDAGDVTRQAISGAWS